MKKTIVIFTNVERQYQRLNQAVRYLNREKLICSDCISLFFNSETVYTEGIRKTLLHSSVVFFLWQGAVYPTEFSNKCKNFLQKNRKRFIMGSSTQTEVEAAHDVDIVSLARVSQYIFNSGTENYRNLWLYLCAKFAGEAVSYLPPAVFPWMGVADFSSEANKLFENKAAAHSTRIPAGSGLPARPVRPAGPGRWVRLSPRSQESARAPGSLQVSFVSLKSAPVCLFVRRFCLLHG